MQHLRIIGGLNLNRSYKIRLPLGFWHSEIYGTEAFKASVCIWLKMSRQPVIKSE